MPGVWLNFATIVKFQDSNLLPQEDVPQQSYFPNAYNEKDLSNLLQFKTKFPKVSNSRIVSQNFLNGFQNTWFPKMRKIS